MKRTHRLIPATATILLGLALIAAAGACGSSGGGAASSPSPSPSVATREQVTSLVDTTAAAIEKDAPGTFAAIDAGKAPYVDPQDPSLYAFVYDGQVTLVADPDPALQGKNMRGVPDAAGICFRDQLVVGGFANGSGWVQYVKEKPGASDLYSKESYYKLIRGSDGKDYVVGAGRYLGPWEAGASPNPSPTTAQPTKAAIKDFVDAAWRHAKDVGQEQAIADFEDPTGPWLHDGLYVFAYDMKGTVLTIPVDPSTKGVDRWDARDPNGTYFVRDLVNTAKSPGSGWVTYLYTNPAAGFAMQDKESYVRGVDDTWLIGAGTYAGATAEGSTGESSSGD
jgi:polar amino acid transport system substrate-binding protein